jgi:uncharacterized membrane protein
MATKAENDKTIREGKIFAILSYLFILSIIPLILKKDNDFVLSHGKQGLVIFVAEVGVFIFSILFGEGFLKLGLFILSIMSFIGIIAVLRGQYIELPVIAKVADKITL